MQRLALLGALAATASLAPAQCNPAPFTTLFAGTTYLGTPDPVVGANMLFDLQIDVDVTISQIDVNLYDDGSVAANPILTGATTQLIVWTTPTTWVGNNTNQAVWTQVATGTLTVAAVNQPSPAIFTTPFTLTAGTYGIALQHMPVTMGAVTGPVHPIYTNPASRVGTPTVWPEQYMTLTAGAGQATAFASGVAMPRVINTNIHYTVPSGAACYETYGEGCYDRPRSFYEDFPVPPATFDLQDTALQFVPFGAGPDNYFVTQSTAPSAGNWFVPTSQSLTLNPPAITATASWDDALSAPITLPFTFNFPTGSTNTIVVGSNGYVFLDGAAMSTAPYYSSTVGLVTDLPRLAPYWGDLDPAAGGNIYYDVEPGTGNAIITWDQVPEWNVSTAVSTFQVSISQLGFVEYRYQTCALSAAPVLTGFSPGNGAVDPGTIDISARLPFQSGDGSAPLLLTVSGRPVIGQSTTLTTDNIPGMTPAGFVFLGLGQINPGMDLAAIGMPGCSQYISPPLNTNFFVVTGSTEMLTVNIPNNSALSGLSVYAQSATLSPGFNNGNVLASNGAALQIGIL